MPPSPRFMRLLRPTSQDTGIRRSIALLEELVGRMKGPRQVVAQPKGPRVVGEGAPGATPYAERGGLPPEKAVTAARLARIADRRGYNLQDLLARQAAKGKSGAEKEVAAAKPPRRERVYRNIETGVERVLPRQEGGGFDVTAYLLDRLRSQGKDHPNIDVSVSPGDLRPVVNAVKDWDKVDARGAVQTRKPKDKKPVAAWIEKGMPGTGAQDRLVDEEESQSYFRPGRVDVETTQEQEAALRGLLSQLEAAAAKFKGATSRGYPASDKDFERGVQKALRAAPGLGREGYRFKGVDGRKKYHGQVASELGEEGAAYAGRTMPHVGREEGVLGPTTLEGLLKRLQTNVGKVREKVPVGNPEAQLLQLKDQGRVRSALKRSQEGPVPGKEELWKGQNQQRARRLADLIQEAAERGDWGRAALLNKAMGALAVGNQRGQADYLARVAEVGLHTNDPEQLKAGRLKRG